jgi:hypothetical protein
MSKMRKSKSVINFWLQKIKELRFTLNRLLFILANAILFPQIQAAKMEACNKTARYPCSYQIGTNQIVATLLALLSNRHHFHAPTCSQQTINCSMSHESRTVLTDRWVVRRKHALQEFHGFLV